MGTDVKNKLVRSGGDTKDWETKSYKVPLLNSDGKLIILTAMGVDEISSEIMPAKVEPALKVFSQFPDLKLKSIRRPSGTVDLLIGLNFMEVHPVEVARKEGLSLWKSKLGPGYLLGGTHPEIWIGNNSEILTTGAMDICRATNHASYKVCHQTQTIKGVNFLEAEELGVGQPKRCDTCKHCVRCSYRVEHMTKTEVAELAMIEQNVIVDSVNKCVRIRYPCLLYTSPSPRD